MNRRERREAARDIVGRMKLKGAEKQAAVRSISSSFTRAPAEPAAPEVVLKGKAGHVERRQTGLLVAKRDLPL